MLLIAIPAALLIGLSLGALGGGGSILTVPALVYLLGQDAHAATTGSLIIVGTTALLGMIAHARAGHVRFRQGIVFAAVGIAGTWLGTHLSAHVGQNALLIGFSLVMLAAAVPMIRRSRGVVVGGVEHYRATPRGRPAVTPRAPVATAVATRSRVWPRQAVVVVTAATGVGLVTGFFGVGGGFVVVPALVLALGYEMPVAVGTSLLVIGINSGVALLARVGHPVHLDWPLLAAFTATAVLGSLLGGRVARRVDPAWLGRGFTVLLVAVALYTATRSALALW